MDINFKETIKISIIITVISNIIIGSFVFWMYILEIIM